jgi:hypothetical protein
MIFYENFFMGIYDELCTDLHKKKSGRLCMGHIQVNISLLLQIVDAHCKNFAHLFLY